MAWRGLLARLAPSSCSSAGPLMIRPLPATAEASSNGRLAVARGMSTNAVIEAQGGHRVGEALEDVPR